MGEQGDGLFFSLTPLQPAGHDHDVWRSHLGGVFSNSTPLANTKASMIYSLFPLQGGVWGKVFYGGEKTACCCIVLCLLTGIFSGCGTCAYLCPMDEKDAYRNPDGTLQDHKGERLPGSMASSFTAHGPRPATAAATTNSAKPTANASAVATPSAPPEEEIKV